jgi:hypothetical protein
MNQQCEFCKRTFQLAEMIETTMMLSLYPVESQAKFCPYCGLDDNGQAAAPELVEALRRIAAGNPAKPGQWLTDIEMAEIARAALASVGAADGGE